MNELVVTTAGTDPDLLDFEASLFFENLENSFGVLGVPGCLGVPDTGGNGVPVVGGPCTRSVLLRAVGVTETALRPDWGALLSDKVGLGLAD